MKKATFALSEERTTEVYGLLIRGGSRADILQYTTKKQWDLSPRQVDAYIEKAKEQIKAKAVQDRDYQYSIAMERLNFILRQAILIQDWQRALAAQKEINTLMGLYPVQKTELSGKEGGAIEIVIRRGGDNG